MNNGEDNKQFSRRGLLAAASIVAPGLALGQSAPPVQAQEYKPAKLPTGLPEFKLKKLQLDPRLVKDFVIAAHFDLQKVKEMLADEPGLLNASFEWGNGDYERAIEGAGHTGQREIALFLIENGARVNLFCSAMLGDLEVVKSMLSAHPSLKESKGPHGISLITHALMGKDQAKPVVDYLLSIGLTIPSTK
jgi:hypothetical protein